MDNKRYFRCPDALWEAFNKTIGSDPLAKNASEKIRELIKDYIKQNKKEC